MTTLNLTAVVLAAGQGTRMRSQTAKVLHEVCGRPMVWYPARGALELGARRVVVVVGHQADSVRDALGRTLPGAPLDYALQSEQNGTGHAVQCALPQIRASGADKVLILYGDVPLVTTATLEALVRAGTESAVALITAEPPDPTGYGRIVRDEAGRVTRIVEHKDATEAERALREVNAGIYLVDTGLLEQVLGRLDDDNAQGEVYLTDVVAEAHRAGQTVTGVPAADWIEVAGVNDRVELARANTTRRRWINEALMRAGVTFEDPAVTYVDATVEVGPDVFLGAGVQLKGATRVAEGATIRAYSVLEDAQVGPEASVGPFARLRPGTVLEREVHVGNFVECKKAHLHPGVKAGHLTYLGDAEVGAGTNIGAGTITCNYDGARKHPTHIGEGAFIGSNTALVAPVDVGNGAYVGAGSTITKSVGDGDLGVARARQRNIEGWAEEKAPRKG